eukprot:CCRYP_011916-RA/>CCRYP_011916-RA protein AED:0.20 eAED:0.20 QI:26/1/1/1/0/0.16/6/546/36
MVSSPKMLVPKMHRRPQCSTVPLLTIAAAPTNHFIQ